MTEPSPTLPRCATLAELKAHEGERVRVIGAFRFPTELAFARNMIAVSDGTKVVLSRPTEAALADQLTQSNQGRDIAVEGIIFTGMIPEKYGIIGRSSDPYLLEISAVEVGPER